MRIVEAGSLSAVARQIGTTQPTVSKHLAALERYLGARLIERATRRLVMTNAGDLFYEHCRQILAQMRTAELALRPPRSGLAGTLRVNAPVALGQAVLCAMVLAFQQRYPDLAVEFSLSDRPTDLAEEQVDVAVREGSVSDAGLLVKGLGSTRTVAVAAPAYLQARGTPLQPQDLAVHCCVLAGGAAKAVEWGFMADGREIQVAVTGKFSADDLHSLRAALLSGAGVGMMPLWMVDQPLAAGLLVPLLERYEPAPVAINAVYLLGGSSCAILGTFLQFLQEAFTTVPGLGTPS